MQGVPGRYIEYILFINSIQFDLAQEYFHELDKKRPGYYKEMFLNHDVIYNTTHVIIDSFRDLKKATFANLTAVLY